MPGADLGPVMRLTALIARADMGPTLSASSLGRHPFCSLLKCSACGSNYVMANATHYYCSGYVNGRVCQNGQGARLDVIEARLLEGIRSELLTDASVARFQAKVARSLRKPAADPAKIRNVESEVANISEVLASGVRSPALLSRLQAAEAELEELRHAAKIVDVDAVLALMPAAVKRSREMVSDLGNAAIDVAQAREVVREMVGTIPVRQGADGVPVALLALNEKPLAAIAGGASYIDLVAGACCAMNLLSNSWCARPDSRYSAEPRETQKAAGSPPPPFQYRQQCLQPGLSSG